MNSLKKLLQLSKFLVVTLVFSLFLFSQSAIAYAPANLIAAMGMPAVDSIFRNVSITEGEFSVDLTVPIPSKALIGKALVSLPDGETGTIDEIAITGPNGKIFGCKNIKVQNNTDLIKSCGGKAFLIPGDTTYYAKGSNFQPQSDVEFSVELFPES
jgi:hypothetical protein